LARGYFETAKELKKRFNDWCGFGIVCNNRGVTIAVEGADGWAAQAEAELREVDERFRAEQARHLKLGAHFLKKWARLEQQWIPVNKIAARNLEWVKRLKD